MYQNYSFKNKELLTFTKKLDTHFVQHYFVKLCSKFQAKRVNSSGTGCRGTWQPMSFIYFASSSPSKFAWHSFFNLARSTCSFYWCYIFSFVIIFTKNIKYRRENTCYPIAVAEQVYSQVNICVRVSFYKMLQDFSSNFY